MILMMDEFTDEQCQEYRDLREQIQSEASRNELERQWKLI